MSEASQMLRYVISSDSDWRESCFFAILRLLPVKYNDVTYSGDQVAVALFGQLWREFFFLLLETVEFYFHKFLVFEHIVQGGDELRADSVLSDFESRLEMLSLGFECADLGVGE